MKRILTHILSGLCLATAFTLYIVCVWSSRTFGVGIDEIIFTLSSPLNGADTNVLSSAMKFCLPRLSIVVILYAVYAFLDMRFDISAKAFLTLKKRVVKISLRPLITIFSVFSIFASLFYINSIYGVVDYLKSRAAYTTIYDEYYVSPEGLSFNLTENGKQKNLLYIYLESMETTYASGLDGGNQAISYIPNLTALAKQNISFSDSELLGGFHNTAKTGYTMGALLSTTAGVPFSFPVGYNDMGKRNVFASRLITLGDILSNLGYNQEFLCGSDSNFAGRDIYFRQHGNYEIFDLFTAREKGYIAEDYFEFWGYEDKILYDIAKNELTRLSKLGEPFNFTMLTVDTHHVSGYLCSECGDEYETQTENVVRCADRQLGDFIEWCRAQDFFKNTVIIITGDHPRMDTDLVEGVDYFDRTIYNCFINTEKTPVSTKNRTFTSLDIFPTILSALGYEWGGTRLGLGTDMFSQTPTLAEELGYDYLNTELEKNSLFYTKFY